MELTAARPHAERRPTDSGSRLVGIVVVAVTMNLLAALLIERAAALSRLSVVTGLLLAAAVAVNGARFLLWRLAHRRYRFSDVMPLTALFFPLVGAVSWLRGEPLSWRSVGGILLITIGAWTLARTVDDDVA